MKYSNKSGGRSMNELRGRCRELAELATLSDPTLTVVRGHYYCPVWGEQPHWWCFRTDGTIYDPTASQFPSGGMGDYVPFNGICQCAECGSDVLESEARFGGNGHYAFCSYECEGRFIGVL